jgi:hypothetical protein
MRLSPTFLCCAVLGLVSSPAMAKDSVDEIVVSSFIPHERGHDAMTPFYPSCKPGERLLTPIAVIQASGSWEI